MRLGYEMISIAMAGNTAHGAPKSCLTPAHRARRIFSASDIGGCKRNPLSLFLRRSVTILISFQWPSHTMADPLSIASGALTVITVAKQTGDAIYNFIRDCREARADLSRITRDLSELSLILELIRDENAAVTKRCLPDTLQTQVQAMLTSCISTVQEIEKTLTKCRGKSGPLRWTMLEKDKVMTLKGSLEAFKSGLSLALETINLSMAREIKHTTETIQDNTAEIKRDTGEILDQIYKLRDQLPRSLPSDLEQLRLEHWLDNLTHYAETIVTDEDADAVSDVATFPDYTEEQSKLDGEAANQPSASTTMDTGKVDGSNNGNSVRHGSPPINSNEATPSSRQAPSTTPTQMLSPTPIQAPTSTSRQEPLSTVRRIPSLVSGNSTLSISTPAYRDTTVRNYSQPWRYNPGYLPGGMAQPKGSLTPVVDEGQSLGREEFHGREIDDFSRAYSNAVRGQLTDPDVEEDRTPLRANAQDRSEGENRSPLWQQNRQKSRNLMWL
ncbi:hypothetical protein F5Y09DRAFT_252670 [Xylaria sp. FL1042]|nr:hypothetical protein F5Y09DRAFT_252670 [Xylaria sp. FL1042]